MSGSGKGGGGRGRSNGKGQSNMNRSSPKRFETLNNTKLSDYVYKIATGGKQACEFTEIT